MQDKREYLLGEAKVETALITLAIPAIIGMMINGIYNVVDTMFVGKLGTEPLSAAAIVYPLFSMIGAIGLTFGVGAGTYVSRLLGQGKKELATKTASTALFSSAVCGAIYIIIGLIFLDPILKLYGATESVMYYAREYAKYLTMGSIFNMVNMTMNNLLRAEGSAKFVMFSMSTGAVLNIILDPIFIFVFGLDIAGAAIATVLSQMVSTILLLSYYITGRSMLNIRFKFITISKTIYSEIMKIGLPTFFRMILASIGVALINNMAKEFGDAAVASIGIVNRIFMLAMFALLGYGQGFQPVAGYNYGALKYDRLNKAIKVSIKWTSIYTILTTIIFMSFSETIIKGFSDDYEVIKIATLSLKAMSILFPLLGVVTVINSLFQALGHAIQAAILSLSRQGIFLIPTVLILPRIYGLNGVIFSQPLADFITIIITITMATKLFKELKDKENLLMDSCN